ncbi:MAG TPA: hypothetical protein PL193_15330 [Xanthobacteraceae bacterium]|nr:hypothetical protein [Xanthobacteraceae bacterium]
MEEDGQSVRPPSRQPANMPHQTDRIRELIEFAKERDALGKKPHDKLCLIEALMTLGRDRKEAERAIENARVRVRKASRKAEAKLNALLRSERLWSWTDPEEAIKQLRSQHFGQYQDAPLTDIELALVQAGNVLWIIAIYPALASAIFARLGRSTDAARERTENANAQSQESQAPTPPMV